MPSTTARPDRPGEAHGRPQLTQEGVERLQERVADIRERRLPDMRPLLIESERDERIVAEFERLTEEADAIEVLVGQAEAITIDPATVDGHVRLGMRVEVVLEDGSRAWVRPVHPDEAFLDDERISAVSPLAVALLGAKTGDTVSVEAPTGAWPCEVLQVRLDGVSA